MGCPITQSRNIQVVNPVGILEAYLDAARSIPVPRRPPLGERSGAGHARADRRGRRQSCRGTCPASLTAQKIVPALLTGCTIVLKPAPETPLDAYLARAASRGGGTAPGRGERGACGSGGERVPHLPPRRLEGDVHRVQRRGTPHRRDLRLGPAPRDPRARRQVRRHPARRCRPRRCSGRPPPGCVPQQRTGVHPQDTRPRATSPSSRTSSSGSTSSWTRCRSVILTSTRPTSVHS